MEDTSVEFDAYPGFPGTFPKFVFEHIGYDGLFRLLKDKDRKAKFFSHLGYCEPNQDPIIFTGEMKGKITEEVFDKEADDLPYSKIFIPEGYDKPLTRIPKEELYTITHRYKSFSKLKKYLKVST